AEPDRDNPAAARTRAATSTDSPAARRDNPAGPGTPRRAPRGNRAAPGTDTSTEWGSRWRREAVARGRGSGAEQVALPLPGRGPVRATGTTPRHRRRAG